MSEGRESNFDALLRRRAEIAGDLAAWMEDWRTEWQRCGLPGDGFDMLVSLDQQARDILAGTGP